MTKRMLRRLLAVGMAAAVMLLVGLWDMAIEQKNICTNRMLEQALPLFEAEPLAEQEQKVAYLTFDDGPSKTTEEVLDILAQYQVKATFLCVVLIITKNICLFWPVLWRKAIRLAYIPVATSIKKFMQTQMLFGKI